MWIAIRLLLIILDEALRFPEFEIFRSCFRDLKMTFKMNRRTARAK